MGCDPAQSDFASFHFPILNSTVPSDIFFLLDRIHSATTVATITSFVVRRTERGGKGEKEGEETCMLDVEEKPVCA